MRKPETPLPGASYLDNNYPNPFNPETHIRFGTHIDGPVRISVFNALGQEVGVLQDGWMKAGWYDVVFDGTRLPSGIYFCRMQTATHFQTRKLALVR